MKARVPSVCVTLAVLCLSLDSGTPRAAFRAAPLQAIAVELEWERGGCYPAWCEKGWYSSPAVADLDGDGAMEVIGASYPIFILDGASGGVEKSFDPPGGRVWPGVVVADVDGDSDLEFVTAHGGGYVHVFDHNGDVVWTRQPVTSELRGLSVYDLDDDGTMEIVVTAAIHRDYDQWFVYEHDGTPRAGWPQLALGAPGYTAGIYNGNNAIADLDGDGRGEIVGPSDMHYIAAYNDDGSQIPANAMYGSKFWSQVGVWESLATELRGWGYCNGVRAESYRPNFAHGPATIADVDANGSLEVVAVGNVYDCNVGHPPGKYNGVYIFNADRSRFNTGGYDWRAVPVDTGAPLSEDWNEIENNQPNPVVADLDGDGEKEILYSSYDGRVHAFWLDKTEHGNWPYAVYTGGACYRFASEPVVADLENDGRAEVIFASWPEKGSGQVGKLHVLDHLGHLLQEVDLPAPYSGMTWNGALAAPTLANLDDDPNLEVVLNTAYSGLAAYELTGTAHARVLWGTGRGNYQRTGSLLHGSLRSSWARVRPTRPGPGDTLTYTVRLENPGPLLPTVRVTSTLPADVHYLDNLWASSGSYGEASGIITWTGAVSTAIPVTITYGVTVSLQITTPHVITSTVWMDDGLGNTEQRLVIGIANARSVCLPLVLRRY